VVLCSPRQKSGNESDAYASSLIPEKVRDTRSFVVFVLRQIRVRELAHGHKERRYAESLHCSKQSDVFVVGSEIDAGVLPHGDGENDVAHENHWLDADFRKNPHNQRS
jgi:hypothetical protein